MSERPLHPKSLIGGAYRRAAGQMSLKDDGAENGQLRHKSPRRPIPNGMGRMSRIISFLSRWHGVMSILSLYLLNLGCYTLTESE